MSDNMLKDINSAEKFKNAAELILESTLAMYISMVQNISCAHIKSINDVIEGGTDRKVFLEIEKLRTSLCRLIQDKFKKCWNDFDVGGSFAYLKSSETKVQDGWIKKLSTNLSPEEIIRSTKFNELKKKKAKLEFQFQYQRNQISELITQVETFREVMQIRLTTREQALWSIEADKFNIEKAENQYATVNNSVMNGNVALIEPRKAESNLVAFFVKS